MSSILHIHAGGCAAAVARATGLEGDVMPWRDSAAVGPCSRDRARHMFLRAAYWQVDLGEIQRPEELPGDHERALWFGPDPWEQLQLVELLAHLSDGPCTIVPLPRAVPMMTTAELAHAFAARVSAGRLRYFAAALWFDYCDNELPGLRLRMQRAAEDPRLPHLSAALQRILQDRTERRTEREVEALVQAGVCDVPALMDALRARELPSHGAWYGDTVVGKLRDAALTRSACQPG